MTISRLLINATKQLKESLIEDPAYEAGLILSYAINKPEYFIYLHPDNEIEASYADSFQSFVDRRCNHEPYCYITGNSEFMSLDFKVNPKVLIPRSDTETLAEAALYALGCDMPFVSRDMFQLPSYSRQEERRVLDIGTGSGCLAVSIARYAVNVKVDALDVCEMALQVAKENAKENGVIGNIRFIQSDFVKDTGVAYPPYDLIISNPPYIPLQELSQLPPDVKDYEPHLALFAGNDGLDFYRRIAFEAARLLKGDGIIVVECGYDQAGSIRDIFRSYDMETTTLKDLSGIERVIAARLNVY